VTGLAPIRHRRTITVQGQVNTQATSTNGGSAIANALFGLGP